LGLASVYGIIKAHGGYIDVESETGSGTTFHVYLPATERQVTEEVKEPDVEIEEVSGTVLLIDDEDMVVDVGSKMLEKFGLTVFTAKNGNDAVTTLKNMDNKVDLVILDMVMPGMSGGETFDQLKRVNGNIKVLLSSGYSLDSQAKGIMDRGCDGFIQKPFNMNQLFLKVREVMN
jgi:CheY-like chemotaxis protein